MVAADVALNGVVVGTFRGDACNLFSFDSIPHRELSFQAALDQVHCPLVVNDHTGPQILAVAPRLAKDRPDHHGPHVIGADHEGRVIDGQRAPHERGQRLRGEHLRGGAVLGHIPAIALVPLDAGTGDDGGVDDIALRGLADLHSTSTGFRFRGKIGSA